MVGRACRRVRGVVRAYPLTTGLVTLFVYITLVGGLALNGVDNEGEQRAREINDNRADVARDSCQAQNDRHDNTIAKLDDLIDDLPPGPEKRRAMERRAGTVLLIEALAPRRDCKRLIRQIRAVDD